MFLEFYDSLCFELVSENNRQLKYLCTEFPVYVKKTQSDVVFKVELNNNIKIPNGTFIDNKKLCVGDSSIYRSRDSFLIDNKYCLSLEENIPLLKIPSNIITQRYMLLRLIYPFIRYYLLKKDALLLKASCTSHNDLSTMYVGWSGAGKTTAILNDLLSGRKYISDTMSIISTSGLVIPLCNKLHVFWRNRNTLLNFTNTFEGDKKRVLHSLYFKQLLYLLTLKKKNLSTIVNIPNRRIETKKTQLSRIQILNGCNFLDHSNYQNNQLVNIIYSINHSECSEFNKLLDVLLFIGVDIFADYWETFKNKIKELIDNIY